MSAPPLLTRTQLVASFAYACVFPLTNLAGGAVAFIGIVISMPFLPISWIGGMTLVWVFGSESAYLFGASITTLIQVLVLQAALSLARRARNVSKDTLPGGQ